MNTFTFKEQLLVGEQGEKDFVRYHSGLSPQKSKDLAYDFILADGTTVELKTDNYSMEKTSNFFMEAISDTKTGKLGGPSRAYKDGVTYFVYYFQRDKTFFWFETEKLFYRLKELVDSGRYKPKFVMNNGWSTAGFAIPRTEFETVLLRKEKKY